MRRRLLKLVAARTTELEVDPDGWMRVTGEDPELVLYAAGGVRPGWHLLRFDGVEATPLLQPTLQVASRWQTSPAVEIALPPMGRGDHRVIIHLDDAADQLLLRPGSGATRFRIAAFDLSRLSLPGLAARALLKSPGTALAASWWRLLGKKVRARNRLRRIFGLAVNADFEGWLAVRQPGWTAETEALRTEALGWSDPPRFAVIIAPASATQPTDDLIASLQRQVYGSWQALVLAPRSTASAAAAGDSRIGFLDDLPAGPGVIEAAAHAFRSDWVVLITDPCRLAPDALIRLAAAVRARPQARLAYWDEDTLTPEGQRRHPHLKPEWNEPYFLAFDYVGPIAFRRQSLIEHGGLGDVPAEVLRDGLILSLAGGGDRVLHVPHILSHRPAGRSGSATAKRQEERRRLAETFIRRAEPEAGVTIDGHGHLRLRRPLPWPTPLVSLIVSTRDRLDLLRACIEGLRAATSYNAIEIIIADNESAEAATHDYLRSLGSDPRVRVVACPGPFNFSAINNRAAREAKGSVLGFINNDVEVIEPGWLAEMVSHAVRPDIGAVGAKLLYANRLVQHAGVVVGLGGLAGHVHRFFAEDHLGYMRRLQTHQYYSAVTAACLVVERAKFEAVGGFDEIAFPVAYNDVDLCLRLCARGWPSFWTPYAVLFHKESASRISDVSGRRRPGYLQECENFRARWAHVIRHDPYYNPNLSKAGEDFGLD